MSTDIRLPLTDEAIAGLHAGDHVRLTGVIYTARDAAHKRIIEALDKGEPLPFDIRGQVIYYVGPTPPRPGRVIGAAGPTTSMRLNPYTPRLLEDGLKGAIGKGGRDRKTREAFKKNQRRLLPGGRRNGRAAVEADQERGGRRLRGPGHGGGAPAGGRGLPGRRRQRHLGDDLLEQGKARYRRRERWGATCRWERRPRDRTAADHRAVSICSSIRTYSSGRPWALAPRRITFT